VADAVLIDLLEPNVVSQNAEGAEVHSSELLLINDPVLFLLVKNPLNALGHRILIKAGWVFYFFEKYAGIFRFLDYICSDFR